MPYMSLEISSSEMCSVEELILNQRHVQFFNSKDSSLIRKVNEYTRNVENYSNLDEFCILTKHDFPCEHKMKDAIFGHIIKNHDSNAIISCRVKRLWMISVSYKAQMQLTEIGDYAHHLRYQWVISRLICTEN